MLAVSFEDFEIHVVDVDMKRVVRIFQGHTNRITDMVSKAPMMAMDGQGWSGMGKDGQGWARMDKIDTYGK